MVARGAGGRGPQAAKADDGLPKLISLRTAEPTEDDRVDLFAVNGTTYQISTKPKINTALKYMHLARTQGSDVAVGYMLETLIGADGYQALMEFDDLTQDDLETIIAAASKIMAGAVEDPKGKRSRG